MFGSPLITRDEQPHYLCDAPSADDQARQGQENLAEQMRLAYVALTRARYRCYLDVAVPLGKNTACDANPLSWLAWGTQHSSPNTFIDHSKAERKEKQDAWQAVIRDGIATGAHMRLHSSLNLPPLTAKTPVNGDNQTDELSHQLALPITRVIACAGLAVILG